MQQAAESVDGSRNVLLAIAALVITISTTSLLYLHKSQPRHSCPRARDPSAAHLEYDVHAPDAAWPSASIVIDLR